MINNTKQKVLSFFYLHLLIAAITIMTACEDEVIDRIVEIPGDTVTVLGFNHIVSFQVKEFSADTVLKAAIKDDSLIVYWPLYKPQPATIAPDIIVADGATITPASGESVPFTTGTTYTVSAEDESKQKYALKVVIYQPEPIYRSGNAVLQIVMPDTGPTTFQLNGDHLIPDTAQTSLYMIDWATEEETKMRTTSVTPTRLRFEVPEDFPKGYYRTRLVSGTRMVSKQDSLWVKFPAPRIAWGRNRRTLKQGETFELEARNLRDIERVEIVGFPDHPLKVVDYTLDAITLRIPADFPIGSYPFAEMKVTSRNSGAGLSLIDLEVIAGL